MTNTEEMRKTIEFVCTGNQGRSPVAELIARNYLSKIGATGEYEAASSGTLAEKIRQGDVPMGFRLKIIGVARERGDVYTPVDVQDLDEAIKKGNDEAIIHYFKKAEYAFIQEERADRLEVLPLFGIEGVIKEAKEQTIVRPESIGVLTMANTNYKQAKEIYAGSGHNPVIGVLSRYVTGDKDAETPNTFGLGKEAYTAAVEKMMVEVPKAVDMLVK